MGKLCPNRLHKSVGRLSVGSPVTLKTDHYMQQASPKHLRLILFGVNDSLVDHIDQYLRSRSVQPHLHLITDQHELIHRLVDGLPHLVLLGSSLSTSQLKAAMSFIERTFADLPVLLLRASPSHGGPMGFACSSVAESPTDNLLEVVFSQANRSSHETKRSRKTRIMQQIDKSMQAIDQLEQQLGSGDLAMELLQSKRYLARLQDELRSRE